MLGDLVFDLIHYANKVSPVKDKLWPLGVTMRANNVSLNDVPPSVANKLREFVASDGYKTDLPLFRPASDAKVKLLNDAWKSALGINGVPISPIGLPTAEFTGDVCVSTVEHDNSQLVWKRPNVPLCDYGDECEGKKNASCIAFVY